MAVRLSLRRKKQQSQPKLEQTEKASGVRCSDCGALKLPAEFRYRSRGGEKNTGFMGRIFRRRRTYRCVPPSEGPCPEPRNIPPTLAPALQRIVEERTVPPSQLLSIGTPKDPTQQYTWQNGDLLLHQQMVAKYNLQISQLCNQALRDFDNRGLIDFDERGKPSLTADSAMSPVSTSRAVEGTSYTSPSQTFDLSMYEDLDPSDPVYKLLSRSGLGFHPHHAAEPSRPSTTPYYHSNGPSFSTQPAYWPYSRPYREGDFEERFLQSPDSPKNPNPDVSTMYG